MKSAKWVHVIIRALNRLGGNAPYAKLKPEIESSGERVLTPKWHQTVEGTIEEYSSDSIRGHKPGNFASSKKDVFEKLGHGHWGIRDYDNDIVREALDGVQIPSVLQGTEKTGELVFVREHWRNWPGDGEGTEGDGFEIDLSRFRPKNAWVSSTHLEVEFECLFIAKVPLDWFPRIRDASVPQRTNFEILRNGLHWRSFDEWISVAQLFADPGT